MFYNTMHWRLCWLSVYGILTYEFKCPDELQRKLRIQEICKERSPDEYSCLMDEQSNTYKESCMGSPDFVRPGQKYVIGVFRKNIKCELSRYQPFKFWSHKLSWCVFSKSLCNGIGQIMSNLGSPSGDSVCRCDHTRGFAFLSNPTHHCYCVPTNEDCNCYKKTCPLNHILTSVIKDFNSTQVASSSTKPLVIVLMIGLFIVISILCVLVFAEFLIIDECLNVSYSAASAGLAPTDKTEVIVGESNENVLLFNQDKTLDRATQGTKSAFMEKRKKYTKQKEIALQRLRNRLSETLSHLEGKNDVIVALEIGLTCSGIAVCLWDSKQEKLMFLLKWESKEQGSISNKTSTSILFTPNKTPDSIGDDAEWRHFGRNLNNHDEWPFYKNYMLTICREQEINREDIAIWDVQKKSRMKAVEIFSSFITNMKDKLLKDIFNGESNTEIQWVFTVPAIWSDKGKQIMSKAAEMAGLSPDKFMLLEEPEAVLKYFSINANEYPTKLPACYRCIVLQVGDNAINSTIMKVEDDTYTMKTTVFSQYEGVIQEVSNFISDLFGTKVSKHCQKNHPLEYMTLFDNVKKEMKCVQPKTDIKMCIPRVWFDIFEDLTTLSDAHMKSHLHQDVDCEGDEMKLKYELFWTFCDNFIQCRLQVIDHILATESVAGIGVLFLAGDFIEPVFVNALKQQYPKHTILIARDPDKVILEGALMSWNEHFLHSSLK